MIRNGGGRDDEGFVEEPKTASGRPRWIVPAGAAIGVVGLAAVFLFLRSGVNFDPAPPPPADDPIEAPRLPSSSLNVALTVPLAVLADHLERVVPRQFGSLEDRRTDPGIPGLLYAFQADRDSLEVGLQGGELQLSTVLRYEGRGWFDAGILGEMTASCQAPSGGPPRVRMVLSTPVETTQDWTLRSRIRIRELSPVGPPDRCLLRGVGVDLTDWIVEAAAASLAPQLAEMDSVLAAVPLAGRAQEAWAFLAAPIRLGEATWLSLRPQAIAWSDLELMAATDRESGTERLAPNPSGNGYLGTVLSLTARPLINVGRAPETDSVATNGALPALLEGEPERGFRAQIQGRLTYESLTRLVSSELVGQEVRLGRRSLRIRSVELTGMGDGSVTLGVAVEGDVRGRIFLTGTPHLDPEEGWITIPDLTFHTETRNVLARGASWILQAGFPDALSARARWSTQDLLAQAGLEGPVELHAPLAELGRLEGSVERVHATALVALRDRVVLTVDAEGWARVAVTDFPPALESLEEGTPR